jgi:S-adenosylmethionine synthetase
VNTYGTITEGMEDWQLSKIIERNFDLRPGMIMQALNLRRPIYKATA